METRLLQILAVFKASFNGQTRELILSHGEKFISVNTNPFVNQALKESISLDKIEQTNQRMELILEALKKFRNKASEKMTMGLGYLDELTTRENSVYLNFGQLTALATTPVGQAIGMAHVIGDASKLIQEDM